MEPIHYIILGSITILYLFRKVSSTKRAKAVKKYLDGEALVIDVRSRDEYLTGHFPKSKNIPIENIASQMKSHHNKEENIIVYCASGARSKMAKIKLLQLGFNNVINGGSFHNMLNA